MLHWILSPSFICAVITSLLIVYNLCLRLLSLSFIIYLLIVYISNIYFHLSFICSYLFLSPFLTFSVLFSFVDPSCPLTPYLLISLFFFLITCRLYFFIFSFYPFLLYEQNLIAQSNFDTCSDWRTCVGLYTRRTTKRFRTLRNKPTRNQTSKFMRMNIHWIIIYDGINNHSSFSSWAFKNYLNLAVT